MWLPVTYELASADLSPLQHAASPAQLEAQWGLDRQRTRECNMEGERRGSRGKKGVGMAETLAYPLVH